MADILTVHPVVLVGGLQDSKPEPAPSDLQELTNFTLFRGRFALRAPFIEMTSLTGATQVLKLAHHNNTMYAIAYHGGSSETHLWELDDDGTNPVDRGAIWSGAAVPVPTAASIEGGLADSRESRLYIADYTGQYATRYYLGPADAAGSFQTVQEDWDDNNAKEDIKYSLVTTFQFHVWGTNYWGLTGETTGVRPEVIHFSTPGLIPETEPYVTYNALRQWWSTDYRPIGKRGDPFTCISEVTNGMVLFKEYQTHLLWGYDRTSWQSRVLSPEAGAIGPYAAAMTDDGLCFFWARGRGPHVTDGNDVIDISEAVRKRVVNSKAASDTVVVQSPTDGLIYFIYREDTDSYPQHWIAYDKTRKVWSGEGEWLGNAGVAVAAGGAVVVPQLTLPGPAGAPSPLANVLLDTFTDTNGTDLKSHTWDVGGGLWNGPQSGTGWAQVQNGKGRDVAASGFTMMSTSGVTHQAGWEAYADVTRDVAGVTNGNNGVLFMGNKSNDYMFIFLEGVDATHVNIKFSRHDVGGDKDGVTLVSNQVLAWGASIRLGATIVDSLHLDLWTEPAGGGSRTVHVSNHTLTASYMDAGHQSMGWKCVQASGSQHEIDNITLRGTSATPLTATAMGQQRIDLAWTNGDVAYDTITEIYRGLTANPTTKIAEVDSGVAAYSDTSATLNPDTTYHYRARHKRNGQYSDYSNNASATTWLAMPTSVVLSGLANGIKVSFTQVADGADVEIYRRRSSEPAYTLVHTSTAVAAGSAYWDDTTVTCGYYYYYYLKAVQTGHTSSANTTPVALSGCGLPTISSCAHHLELDYLGSCFSRCSVDWSGPDMSGNYVKIERFLDDDPMGTGYVVGTVPADSFTFMDDPIFLTSDASQANRALFYRLYLLEGSSSGPVVDTCDTSTQQIKIQFCAEQ